MKQFITPFKAMLMGMLFFWLGAAAHTKVEIPNSGPKKHCLKSIGIPASHRTAAACPCTPVSGAIFYFLDSSGSPFAGTLCDGNDSISGTAANGDAYYDGDAYFVHLAAGSQVTFTSDNCVGNPVSLTVCDGTGVPVSGAYSAAACPNVLSFTAPADDDYYVVMNVNGVDGGAGSVGIGDIYCVRQAGTSLPTCITVANDALCNAITLVKNGAWETENTTNANVYDTDDAAIEADYACSAPNNTVWYAYTPSVAETLDVVYASPTGGLDGWLAIFTTTNLCVDPVTYVNCTGGPAGADDTVRINVPMAAGLTYLFMVDGVSGAVGEFSISLQSTAAGMLNDMYCNAIPLTSGGAFESSDNTAANVSDANDTEAAAAGFACSTPNNTLWYSYTPAADEVIQVAYTSPSGGLDGWLGVFSTSSLCVDPIAYIGCFAGPTGVGDTAYVNVNCTAGTTYLFMVDGYAGAVGAFSLGVTVPVTSNPCTVNPNATWLFSDPNGGTGGFTGYLCGATDSVSATGANMYYDGDAYMVNLFTGTQVTFHVEDCVGNPVSLTICDTSGTPIPGYYSASACQNSINYTATYDGAVYCVMAVGGACGGAGSAAIGSLYCVGSVVPPCVAAPANDTICGAVNLILNDPAVSGNTTFAESTDPRDADVDAAGYGGCSTPNNTLWYAFTPAVADSFDVVVTDAGTGFQSWLGIFSTPAGASSCSDVLTNVSPTGDCFEGTNVATFADVASNRVYMDPANTYYIMIDGFSGAVGAFTIAVNSMNVGLNEFEQNIRAFDLFPNPAADQLNVKYAFHDARNVTVELLDLTGRVVSSQRLNNAKSGNLNFDVKNFNNGLYLLRMSSNDGSSTRKVMVQH